MSDSWDFLAVEIAARLRETLGATDQDSSVYEYIGEARKAVAWLKGCESVPEKAQIEDELSVILKEYMSHDYNPELFGEVASFVGDRLHTFERQGLLSRDKL